MESVAFKLDRPTQTDLQMISMSSCAAIAEPSISSELQMAQTSLCKPVEGRSVSKPHLFHSVDTRRGGFPKTLRQRAMFVAIFTSWSSYSAFTAIKVSATAGCMFREKWQRFNGELRKRFLIQKMVAIWNFENVEECVFSPHLRRV